MGVSAGQGRGVTHQGEADGERQLLASAALPASLGRALRLGIDVGQEPSMARRAAWAAAAEAELSNGGLALPERLNLHTVSELHVAFAVWGSHHGTCSWREICSQYLSKFFPPRPEAEYVRVVMIGVRQGLLITDLAKVIGLHWEHRREAVVVPTQRLFELLSQPEWERSFVRWAVWYGLLNREFSWSSVEGEQPSRQSGALFESESDSLKLRRRLGGKLLRMQEHAASTTRNGGTPNGGNSAGKASAEVGDG